MTMKTRPYGRSLKTRVPVSTTENPSPEKASQRRPIGLNKLHEQRCLTSLIEYYGWTLAADGNLYSPNPEHHALESNAA